MTKYVSTKVNVLDRYLYVDGNSKITADNGTYGDPKPNAFSLPHIATCPGSTESCRKACYVHGLRGNAPDVYEQYMHNECMIHGIINGDDAHEHARVFGDWIEQNCKGGFRWHVSGDVFCSRYADWIVNVCKSSPSVGHWIYTRSFYAVPTLVCAENITVNVSADRDNLKKALPVAFKHGLNIAYFSTGEVPMTLSPNDIIFPDYSVRQKTGSDWFDTAVPKPNRSQVCPADNFGQSEAHRCGVCKKCL